MKNIILLLAFILISTVKAGTCTSISRTNSASLSVLTSTKYNTDLNTVYTAVNSLDGGCITDGTLETDALNTTEFAPLLKGLQQGCKVLYSNASTLQIDKCLASVNGNLVTTATTTNVSFGCSGCSAEVASTAYYVYIQTGSSGSTLTPLILTTAPNNDGYDNSGNKVLAKFYNNPSSDISSWAIYQWKVSGFDIPSKLAGEAYIAATSNCTPNSAISAVGAFTADADCPGPTIVRELVGDWLTTDADGPTFTINALPPGYYEAIMSAFTSTSGTTTGGLAINDGTTTCIPVGAFGTATGGAPATVVCTFYYSEMANRTFKLYGGAATGSITLLNSTTAPANGIKFSLKFLGEE